MKLTNYCLTILRVLLWLKGEEARVVDINEAAIAEPTENSLGSGCTVAEGITNCRTLYVNLAPIDVRFN